MNTMTQCPPDSELMKAWEKYQATEDYKNSHSWATRFIPEDDPAEVERVRATGKNYLDREYRLRAVEGSLWAAFTAGFSASGGKVTF